MHKTFCILRGFNISDFIPFGLDLFYRGFENDDCYHHYFFNDVDYDSSINIYDIMDEDPIESNKLFENEFFFEQEDIY